VQRVFLTDNLISEGQMDRKKKFNAMKTESCSGKTKISLTVPCFPQTKSLRAEKNTAGLPCGSGREIPGGQAG